MESYTAGQDREPDYVGPPDRHFDARNNTFDLLEEGLGNLGDAWWCLYQAMKKSVYFEPDEDSVERIEHALWALEKQLQPIVRRYRP